MTSKFVAPYSCFIHCGDDGMRPSACPVDSLLSDDDDLVRPLLDEDSDEESRGSRLCLFLGDEAVRSFAGTKLTAGLDLAAIALFGFGGLGSFLFLGSAFGGCAGGCFPPLPRPPFLSVQVFLDPGQFCALWGPMHLLHW